MKVIFSFQNNNSSKIKKQPVAFEAGLTPKMMQEILQTDVLEISSKLAGKGIPTDFKGNQIIAWCCDKTVELFEQFNKQYATNLSLPRGIYVNDFKNLNTDTPRAYGICNLTRTELIKGSKEIVPPQVVFFNTEYNWNNIDLMADRSYASKHSSTDFFLYPVWHEFAHVLHEDNLLETFDGKKVLKKILTAKKPREIILYRKKYGDRISQICTYALTDPIEAIGCDLPVRILTSIDKENLKPIKNPFIDTPYEKGVISKKYSDKERPLPEILRNIWNDLKW